jgi:LPXTG-motif cell wall-anchored protein
MINKRAFSLLPTPVLAGVGVLLFLGGSQASADGLTQDSKITSISTSACSDTAGYTVNIGGNFPSPIKNVAVNGIDIGSSNFMQFPDKLMINIPASHQRTFTIDVFNWLLPMLDTQTFHCSGTGADTMVIPTRSGGILPMTGTNNYNFLLSGMVLSLLGASGLLLRRRVQS